MVSKLVVDDTKCLVLIDLGGQLPTIAITFMQQLGLEIYHLNKIFNLEAMGGAIYPIWGMLKSI